MSETVPAPRAPRDPWTALARHLTTADPWRRVPFLPPPALPTDDDTPEQPA